MISNSKSKYKSKYSNPGVLMSGSPTPRTVIHSSPTPGITMPMSVYIFSMVFEFPSSSTPVSTLPLMVSTLSSLARFFFILFLKGEVFVSLIINGSQFFHAADNGCRHGNYAELFARDVLPCCQEEGGVAALEVGCWTKADRTSRFLIIYII